MSIQGISAEDRALVSVVDQQGLARSLAAVCSKKGLQSPTAENQNSKGSS